ncbi:hypothetical protein E2C01_039344 [Portunus trituberculatus]|uniref:Uncharacterized protein n=1 Tax=Portunus trituberculatus TaxID=210409 RepID=A0A5B7FL48_PORTR|nr:hypothetical protein [Portunus trituberculatus]
MHVSALPLTSRKLQLTSLFQAVQGQARSSRAPLRGRDASQKEEGRGGCVLGWAVGGRRWAVGEMEGRLRPAHYERPGSHADPANLSGRGADPLPAGREEGQARTDPDFFVRIPCVPCCVVLYSVELQNSRVMFLYVTRLSGYGVAAVLARRFVRSCRVDQ